VLQVVLPERDREFYLGDLEESGGRGWLREIAGAFALRFGSGSLSGSGAGRTGQRGLSVHAAVGLVATDLRLGVRRVMRTPGSTLTILTALSVGIGLATLMFSLIDGALLPTLPFAAGDRIVQVRRLEFAPVSPAAFEYWRERQRSFEGLAAHVQRPVNLTIAGGSSAPIASAALSPETLGLLSVQPALGRGFTEADASPGAPAVVLIGHETWRRELASDPGVLGRTVRVNGEPAEVIGVMPEGFGFPFFQELWMPLRLDVLRPDRRGEGGLLVFGVLREGVSMDAAAAELNAIELQRPVELETAPEPVRIEVAPYTDIINPRGRTQLLASMMLGVALLVLLVACANGANVLLAQAAVRGREVAVRASLGASRARIATQFWTEVSILALAGAAGGILFAMIGVRLVVDAAAGAPLPFWFDFRIDLRVLGFVAGAAVLAAGVAPAVHASRANGMAMLKDASRGASSRRVGRLMARLIGVEMAASFVLLVAAGLFVRSVMNLRTFEFGFAPEGVYATYVRLPDGRYEDAAERAALIERLDERLGAIGGAISATVTTSPPGIGAERRDVAIEGVHDPAAVDLPDARLIAATPGFFGTFGADAVAGRLLEARDRAGTLRVAVVNRAFELAFLPGGAVGHRIAMPVGQGEVEWLTIVGVTQDLMAGGLEQQVEEAVYRPLVEDVPPSFMVAVRSAGAPLALAGPVRDAIAAADPDLALSMGRTLESLIRSANAHFAWLSAMFLVAGALALFLAAIGLYGVMAFQVAQRVREIGVRMALGSGRAGIVRIVLGRGTKQIAAGLLAGTLVAAPIAWLLRIFLLDVPPFDPIVFTFVPGVLVAAGWLGCLLPALRATRVDPQVALGSE
jgi:predicted permease